MKTHKFKEFWTQKFNDEPPLSFRLKDSFNPQWLRFHALPNSKRYPENQTEYEIVLQRANDLAGVVLGENSECWMVCCYPLDNHEGSEEEHASFGSLKNTYGITKAFEFKDIYEAPSDQSLWVAYAKLARWNYGKFNQHLIDIADEAWPKLYWISVETRNIFAPYDGGFDLILSSHNFRSDLRKEYSNWLSDHLSGY